MLKNYFSTIGGICYDSGMIYLRSEQSWSNTDYNKDEILSADEAQVWGEKMCESLEKLLGDEKVAEFSDGTEILFRIQKIGEGMYNIWDIKEKKQYGINYLGVPTLYEIEGETPSIQVLREKLEKDIVSMSQLQKQAL